MTTGGQPVRTTEVILSSPSLRSTMGKRSIIALVLTVTFYGCTRPGDHPFNPNCEWQEQDTPSLDLTNRRDQRHLRHDALTAEDLAIRFATKNAGPKSGHFAGWPEYWRQMDECMDRLFVGLSKYHGIDRRLAGSYRFRRNALADAAVLFAFFAFYALAAYSAAGVILRRFSSDGVATTLIAVVCVAIVCGVAGSAAYAVTVASASAATAACFSIGDSSGSGSCVGAPRGRRSADRGRCPGVPDSSRKPPGAPGTAPAGRRTAAPHPRGWCWACSRFRRSRATCV